MASKSRRVFDRPKISRMLTPSTSRLFTSRSTVRMEEGEGTSSSSTHSDSTYRGWNTSESAKSYFLSLFTAIYALILITFSLVVEVSPAWKTDIYITESVFHGYMYGVGIVFLSFLYFVLLYPSLLNIFLRFIQLKRNKKPCQLHNPMYSGEGAGSLYLRLGAMCIVLYGLEIFLCMDTPNCEGGKVSDLVFSILILFLQIHFIFCHSKVTITRFKTICKIGFMHLTAANLWTWIRFVAVKQQAKIEKKQAHMPKHSSESSEEEEDYKEDMVDVFSSSVTIVMNEMNELTTTVKSKTLPSIKYFGDIATLFTTFLVEFALIAAAVTFIIWRSIDNNELHDRTFENGKRKHKMRVDCSSSSTGLFAGMVFLIAACIAMGIYAVFDELQSCEEAQLVFGIFDTTMFVITLVACLLGMWRMRRLAYAQHKRGEVLDEILLFVGLIGELLYCCCEMDVFITPREGFKAMPPYIFVMYVFRLIQVSVQTVFILMSFRLHSSSFDSSMQGKQFVTFLLVANVTLFFFHVYEGMKKGFGYEMNGDSAYTVIIYTVTPLIVFYRFHSSVCLAEIWKHAYSKKESRGSVSTVSLSSLPFSLHSLPSLPSPTFSREHL